ncbi:MAG: TIGR03619 family F420-dependent LLM class oxidoreductase [Spirochaetaceae bacterium]|nr:TIGR03619 family F420-dependent LLM class oxidoreductase [Myxococcales bacterium]MCB9726756.1 TIGR03619 family F420-dependent LLM class oxidoreductase [Spirochaetaceae bacterium]HPG24050.1 TIGR03619 family F420-dependent LLM class oxidoreductase [Myxococcota bacterium]
MKFSLAISMCDPSHYVPLARAAEAAGWDSVCVPDGGPWTESTTEAYGTGGRRWWGPETPFLEPFVVIAAMAAVTERIRFYTNVWKLPARSPLHTARMVASAWALAPGRIGLGIGLGWNREEFDALGVDFDTRGGRADEALGIVRALLRGEWVEHRGRHFTIPRLRQSPVVSGPLPIYVGGDSPVAMRRAARLGDGWIARAPSVDDVIALVPRMRGVLAREGRDFAGFDVLAMCPDASDEASLLLLAEGGVDEIELWPWNRYGVGLDDLPGKLDAVARYADEVIAPVRSVLGG